MLTFTPEAGDTVVFDGRWASDWLLRKGRSSGHGQQPAPNGAGLQAAPCSHAVSTGRGGRTAATRHVGLRALHAECHGAAGCDQTPQAPGHHCSTSPWDIRQSAGDQDAQAAGIPSFHCSLKSKSLGESLTLEAIYRLDLPDLLRIAVLTAARGSSSVVRALCQLSCFSLCTPRQLKMIMSKLFMSPTSFDGQHSCCKASASKNASNAGSKLHKKLQEGLPTACIQLHADGAHLVFKIDGWHLSFMLMHLLEILCHTILIGKNGTACTEQSRKLACAGSLNGQQFWNTADSMAHSSHGRCVSLWEKAAASAVIEAPRQVAAATIRATADPWTSCRPSAPL